MLKKIASLIVNGRWIIMGVFALMLAFSVWGMLQVDVNYNLSNYLPDDSDTIISMNVMEDEFGLSGQAEVMVNDINLDEAMALKDRILNIKNVDRVTFYNTDIYFNDPDGDGIGSALFKIIIDGYDYSENAEGVIADLKVELADYDIELNGQSVFNTALKVRLSTEMVTMMILVVCIVAVILLITSTSWFEPAIFGAVIGVAILLNMGTNYFLGEISYIVKSIAAILQLALSMDYAIVTMHNFNDERQRGLNPKEAMIESLAKSLSPVSASGLTTLAGLAAIMFMTFKIGIDIGAVLMKAIAISMLTVFMLMPGLILLFVKPIDKLKHEPLLSLLKHDATVAPRPNKYVKILNKTKKVMPLIMVALIVVSYILQSSITYTYVENNKKAVENGVVTTFGNSNQVYMITPLATDENGGYEKQKQMIEYLSRYTNSKGEKTLKDTLSYMTSIRLDVDADSAATLMNLDPNIVKQLFGTYYIEKNMLENPTIALNDFVNFVVELVDGKRVIADDIDVATMFGEENCNYVRAFKRLLDNLSTQMTAKDMTTFIKSLSELGIALNVNKSTATTDVAINTVQSTITGFGVNYVYRDKTIYTASNTKVGTIDTANKTFTLLSVNYSYDDTGVYELTDVLGDYVAQVYGMYYFSENPLNAPKLNLKSFISYLNGILQDPTTSGVDISGAISDDTKDKINQFDNLIGTLNSVLSADDLYDAFSSFADLANIELSDEYRTYVRLIYGNYGFQNALYQGYNANFKSLIGFIDGMVNDSRLDPTSPDYDSTFTPLIDVSSALTAQQKAAIASLSNIFDMMESENSSAQLYAEISALLAIVPNFNLEKVVVDQIYGIEYFDTAIEGHDGHTLPAMNLATFITYADQIANDPTWSSMVSATLKSQISGLKYLVSEVMPSVKTAQDLYTMMNDARVTALTNTQLALTEFNVIFSEYLQRYNDYKADAFSTAIAGTLSRTADGTSTIGGNNYYYNSDLLYSQNSSITALPDSVVTVDTTDYYLDATSDATAGTTSYAFYVKNGTINTVAKTVAIGTDNYTYTDTTLYKTVNGSTVNEAGNTVVIGGSNYTISGSDLLNQEPAVVGAIDTVANTFTLNGIAYAYTDDGATVSQNVGTISATQIIVTGAATYRYENSVVYANTATATVADNTATINAVKYLYKNNALYTKAGSIDNYKNTATFDNLAGATYYFNADGDLFLKENIPTYWYIYQDSLYQAAATETATVDTVNKAFTIGSDTYYYTDYTPATDVQGNVTTREIEGTVSTTLRRVTFNAKTISPTVTRNAYSFYYTANSNVLTDTASGTDVGSIDTANNTVTITSTDFANYMGTFKFSGATVDNMYTESTVGKVDNYFIKLDADTLPLIFTDGKLYAAELKGTFDQATGNTLLNGVTYAYMDGKVYNQAGTSRLGFYDAKRLGIYPPASVTDYVVQYVYNYRDSAVAIDYVVTTQAGDAVAATNLDTANRTFEVGGNLYYYLSDNVSGAISGYGEFANWNIKDTVDNLYVSTADFYAFLGTVGPDLIGGAVANSNYWSLLSALGSNTTFYTYKSMVSEIKTATGLIPGYDGFEINEETMYVLYCLYYFTENPSTNYDPSTETTYTIIQHKMLPIAQSTSSVMQFAAKMLNGDPTAAYYDMTCYNASIAQMLSQEQINSVMLINTLYKEYLDTALTNTYDAITSKLNGWLASVTAANQVAPTVDLETVRQMYIMNAVETNYMDNNIASSDTALSYKVLGSSLNKYLSAQITDNTSFISTAVGSYLSAYTLTKTDVTDLLAVALDNYTVKNHVDLNTYIGSLATKVNNTTLNTTTLGETLKQVYVLYFIDATVDEGENNVVAGASATSSTVTINGRTYNIVTNAAGSKLFDADNVEAGAINTTTRTFTLHGSPFQYQYSADGATVTQSYTASFLQDQIKVATMVDYINGLIIVPTDTRFNSTLSGYVGERITQLNTALNAVLNIIDRQNEQMTAVGMSEYIKSLLSMAGSGTTIDISASDIDLAYTLYAVQKTFIPVTTTGSNTITTSIGQLIDYVSTLLVKTNNNNNFNETIATMVGKALTNENSTEDEQKSALQNLVFALNTFTDIYARAESNNGYTYTETAELFNDSLKAILNDTLQGAIGASLDLTLDASLVEQVYVKYFADYDLLPSETATVENLIAFITELLDTNVTISGFVSDDQKALLTNYETQLTAGASMFNGTDHSRIIFVLNLDEGSEETFAFIDTMRQISNIVYEGEETYLAGNSISLRDISAAFSIDRLITTVISIVAILLVVALVYTSLSIPIILIILIQSAIWISFALNPIMGQSMFFMTYIITTCIQMGATIDYGIIVSSNYVEARKTMPKMTAMTAALKKSMTPILTSGLVLTISGFTINFVSTSIAVSSIGELLGRGTIVSVLLILIVLPQLLMLLDKLIEKTTLRTKFYAGSDDDFFAEQQDNRPTSPDAPTDSATASEKPQQKTATTAEMQPIVVTSRRRKKQPNSTVAMPKESQPIVQNSEPSTLSYTSYAQYIDENK